MRKLKWCLTNRVSGMLCYTNDFSNTYSTKLVDDNDTIVVRTGKCRHLAEVNNPGSEPYHIVVNLVVICLAFSRELQTG